MRNNLIVREFTLHMSRSDLYGINMTWASKDPYLGG